ncbi:hypothetical protein PJN38_08865 [Mycobacterium kansasii]|uniref:hypothetical protein n=1 Tax=Mycobacterium kansasii TaxID=1768 RepID=UPI0002E5FD9E|nr:hypothetical protein [Mycobacterium kansasii]
MAAALGVMVLMAWGWPVAAVEPVVWAVTGGTVVCWPVTAVPVVLVAAAPVVLVAAAAPAVPLAPGRRKTATPVPTVCPAPTAPTATPACTDEQPTPRSNTDRAQLPDFELRHRRRPRRVVRIEIPLRAAGPVRRFGRHFCR